MSGGSLEDNTSIKAPSLLAKAVVAKEVVAPAALAIKLVRDYCWGLLVIDLFTGRRFDLWLINLISIEAIRSNILNRETLTLVKQAFFIIGEESHRNVTSHVTTKPTTIVFAAKAFDNKRRPNNNKNKRPNLDLTCTHCDKPGHTVDRCYKLNGYPAGYAKRNFNAKPTVSNNASASTASVDVLAKNSGTDNKTSNSHVSLTNDQLSRLMNLFNDSGVSSANSSIGADQVLNVLNKSLNLDSQYVSDHLCDTCNKAKQTREPLSLSDHKSTKIRQLVHLDVWRPYRITSIDGFRYFLTVVDDYSRAVWTYMLKGKDDVYDSIVNFVNVLSNQCETNVKVFRSDNGSEFANNRLQRLPLLCCLASPLSTLCMGMTLHSLTLGRVSLDDDGTKLNLELQDDSEATSMSENTHPKGNVSNETNVSSETNFAGDMNDSSEHISEIGDLPVNTVWRSMRQTKLPSSLNDFIINGKVKYGVKKVVNYANFDHDSFCIASRLNRSVEPSCYDHVILDNNLIDAMNFEIEALNENHTWIITDLPPNRKPIKCKWIYKIKYKSNKFIALLVYVDDTVITGNCVDEINEFKIYFKSKFNIKDLGSLKYFLGIKVIKTGNDLCLTQRKYCLELLKEYGLLRCKTASTPMEPNYLLPYVPTDSDHLLDNITGYQQLLGKLIYLTHTRPDIFYIVHSLAQHIHYPLKSHLSCALNVLRYLKGAPRKGIKYTRTNNGNNLVGYSDADWAKCVKTKKFITGYCVFFNSCLISWKSKKQNTLSRSFIEAEYRSMSSTTCEIIWIQKLLLDLKVKVTLPIDLFCIIFRGLSVILDSPSCWTSNFGLIVQVSQR
nr:ribonuclease H-like domain-containing protein [Tanacetum cinerariifolium]